MGPPDWWTDGYGARDYVIARYDVPPQVLERRTVARPTWRVVAAGSEIVEVESLFGEVLRVPLEVFWRGWQPL
jgi:hypothetical protein